MRIIVMLLSGAALLASEAALAQSTAGFYGGLGIGKAKAKLENGDFSFNAPGTFLESKDEVTTGYKIFGGYNFGRNFAAEFSYTDFGTFNYIYDASPIGLGRSKVSYSPTSWAVSAIARFYMTDSFSVLGRLGVTSNKVERSTLSGEFTTIPSIPSASKRRASAVFGAGVQYDFTQTVGLRFEYENYGKFGEPNDTTSFATYTGTGQAKIHMFSLSGVVRF